MFDLARLYQILRDTTMSLRKGAEIETRRAGGLEVTEINAMPHESELRPEFAKIDLELLAVGVDKAAAERHKAELTALLDQYPEPARLAAGPSYIEVGGVIGSQEAAFQLFALGEVLGLWRVVTPAMFHLTGAEARDLAGGGFVMISGYRPGEREGGDPDGRGTTQTADSTARNC